MGWYSTFTKRVKNGLRIRPKICREMFAEMLGTFILITLGNGAVAQSVVSGGTAGTTLSINLSYGIGVTFGIIVAGGVTGGHLNPSVSLALALMGRLQWRKLPLYMIAQYAGSFLSAAALYGVYYDALNAYDGGTRMVLGDKATASIFATYPSPGISTAACFVDQLLGTGILTIGALAVGDKRNMGIPGPSGPVLMGTLVASLGMALGYNCGYPINPARDLSPRIFTAIAGWGSETFSVRNYNYFWVPIVGPHVGAIFGTWVYQFCVGVHWPAESDDSDEEDELRPPLVKDKEIDDDKL